MTLTTTHQNNKAIREVGSLKARSIFHCETNQCHGFLTQTSKIYENPSYVSCFLVGTLPRIYYFMKNPWSPSTYWSRWWTKIWSGKHFRYPIKWYGRGAWISSIISKQAQVPSLWNSSLKGEVMSWMQTLDTIL